jgi:exodeoxyribonuclease VII small subunit
MDRTESLPPADAPASFEDAQAELDELVRALEFCRSRLDAVEEQVKVLEEGQLKPWTRP